MVFNDCHPLKIYHGPIHFINISLWTTVLSNYLNTMEHWIYFHITNCLIIPRWLRGLYTFEKVVNRLSLPWAQWPCLWHIFRGYPPTVTERAPATLRRHRWLYRSTSTTRGLKLSFCGQTFLGHCPVGCFCDRPASVTTRCLFPLKQTLSLRFIILNATLEVPFVHFFLCFGNHLVLLLIQKLHLQMFIKCTMLMIKAIHTFMWTFFSSHAQTW